jgi:hypothetical protein
MLHRSAARTGAPVKPITHQHHMKNLTTPSSCLFLRQLTLACLLATGPTVFAENAPTDFTTEPDKTLAAAHESFLKKDTDKAAEQIHKAAAGVKAEADKVTADSKAGMKKAGDELDKLGDGVKAGTVKSETEVKQTFAKVDHQIATCWHQTAAATTKAGKDATDDLKQAGASLSGAAKWSNNKLKEGTQSTVDAVKKAGKATSDGIKTGAEEVNKWFKGIGEGITDLGSKL